MPKYLHNQCTYRLENLSRHTTDVPEANYHGLMRYVEYRSDLRDIRH